MTESHVRQWYRANLKCREICPSCLAHGSLTINPIASGDGSCSFFVLAHITVVCERCFTLAGISERDGRATASDDIVDAFRETYPRIWAAIAARQHALRRNEISRLRSDPSKKGINRVG